VLTPTRDLCGCSRPKERAEWRDIRADQGKFGSERPGERSVYEYSRCINGKSSAVASLGNLLLIKRRNRFLASVVLHFLWHLFERLILSEFERRRV